MAWLVLVLSGFLEAVWATALGMSDHFKRWRPTLAFARAMPASLAGLAYSMTSLPTGTAYAVWVGIGAIVVSAVTFSGQTAFPGYAALLPTVGAALALITLRHDRVFDTVTNTRPPPYFAALSIRLPAISSRSWRSPRNTTSSAQSSAMAIPCRL